MQGSSLCSSIILCLLPGTPPDAYTPYSTPRRTNPVSFRHRKLWLVRICSVRDVTLLAGGTNVGKKRMLIKASWSPHEISALVPAMVDLGAVQEMKFSME